MKVKFKKLHPDAQIFVYQREGDAGADIYSNEEVVINPMDVCIVKTGIAVQLPKDHELQIRCRSGLASKGIVLANGIGTIDETYRGEIGVILLNTNDVPKKIYKGDRIAQAVLAPVLKAEFVEVDELSETERGDKGFGSTGV